MQTERERIQKGFEEMRGILDREERRELFQLEDDQVHVLDNLAMAKDQVAQQRQYMRELVSGLQCHNYESSVRTLPVRLGTEPLYTRSGENTEMTFPSPVGPCTFFLIKRFL